MSCIFCDSSYHLSQYCNIFICDFSRKCIAKLKQLCEECLTKECFCETSEVSWWNKYFSINNCYICYSDCHLTVFCPDRFTASKFFFPNIDHDLSQRFMAMFDQQEKYLMVFNSPQISKVCKLQPLKIYKTLNINEVETVSENGTKFIVCKKLELRQSYFSSRDYPFLYSCVVLSETLMFSNDSIISRTFLMLLSSKTRILNLSKAEIKPRFTMDEIFEKAPNLDVFEYDTMYDDSWKRKNFFIHNYGKHFKKFKITVHDKLYFKWLIPFLNKGPSKVEIGVYISKMGIGRNVSANLLLSKMMKFFTPVKLSNNSAFALYFQNDNDENYKHIGSYSLKKFVE